MAKWLLGSALALSLVGCANHLQTLDQQLTTALAGEPVVINTQETSSGLSGLLDLPQFRGEVRACDHAM